MNDKVQKIYEYVQKQEDKNYELLKGDCSTADMICSQRAACFQMVRYYIEEMIQADSEDGE